MRKFKETHIDNVQLTELDMDYPFYTDEDQDESNQVETSNETICEVPSLDIDKLIEELMFLKDRGANRVYIAEHVDHYGYELDGVLLEETITA